MNNLLSTVLLLIGIIFIGVYYGNKYRVVSSKIKKRSLAVVEEGECVSDSCNIKFSFVVGSEKIFGTYSGPPFDGISTVKGGSVTATYNPEDPKDNTLLKPPQSTDSMLLNIGIALCVIAVLIYIYS